MIIKRKDLKSNLDLHTIKRKQLSIQFSLDGFSFCVFDLDLLKFIVYKEYTFKQQYKTPEELLTHVKQVFLAEEMLLDTYERKLVIHVNDLSAFVPTPLFDENNLETYIKYGNRTYDSDFFEYDLVSQEMVSVFVPYIHINNFLIDQFGSFEYKHFSSILVEKLINYYTNKTGTTFFIHVFDTHFEIIVAKQKKLVLYNTFKYANKEDFAYYVLFVIEQLQCNPEVIPVKLLGKIDLESELFTIIYNYIRNVSMLDYNAKFDAILSINDTVQREEFCLFNTIN